MSEENKEPEKDEKTPDIKNKKVKFDPEQLAVVNGLYNEAWSLASQKKEAELQEKLRAEKEAWEQQAAEREAELKKQLEEAAKGKKEEKKDPPPPPPVQVNIEENPVFKQMQAQFAEMRTIFDGVKQERDKLKDQVEQARAERKMTRKKDQFLNALTEAKVSFFDPLEAYDLAQKEGLEYDEDKDRVFVRNEATGQPKLNENGEPMTAVDFVKEFASRKKYLVKAEGAGGLGQGPADKVKEEKPAPKDWSKATQEELEAERQRILTQQRK